MKCLGYDWYPAVTYLHLLESKTVSYTHSSFHLHQPALLPAPHTAHSTHNMPHLPSTCPTCNTNHIHAPFHVAHTRNIHKQQTQHTYSTVHTPHMYLTRTPHTCILYTLFSQFNLPPHLFQIFLDKQPTAPKRLSFRAH
ncbi:unnamed protein product [Rangifer tarandus platyrhynchus]|uniref:Uncharacterized protein n=1 Tax=Rangifer tarandus platyrhynchus TaxID=3082113 RepID=A0AC59YCB3_RANTA